MISLGPPTLTHLPPSTLLELNYFKKKQRKNVHAKERIIGNRKNPEPLSDTCDAEAKWQQLSAGQTNRNLPVRTSTQQTAGSWSGTVSLPTISRSAVNV